MARMLAPAITAALLAALCLTYLANTFLYLTPPNPLKADWLPLITRLAHPLFAQNWHLFAPDPIRSNYVLSARCRTRGRVSPWQDLTQPMLARHHANRTSPMSRMLRVQQNAIRLTLGFSYDEWRPLICRRDPNAPVCRGQTPVVARQREIGGYLLRRIASVSCDGLVGPGRTEAVQIAILIHTPPPWSRRNSTDQGTTRLFLLPWAGYEPVR